MLHMYIVVSCIVRKYRYRIITEWELGLSLKFKTEARSGEVLNVNEIPTMRLLCCLYAYKAHFLLSA